MSSKATFKATTPATRVHPAVGSPAEGQRRRIRSLKNFAIDLTTVEGTALATDILNAVRSIKSRGRNGNFKNLTITARRAAGPSTVTVTVE